VKTKKDGNKTILARSLGVSRSSLYYVSKKDKKDWISKSKIEGVLRKHPSYGSRRIAQALLLNRKGVKRVMQKFGVKPYRRRGRKWRKKKPISVIYPNLLFGTIPAFEHHIWAADFTEIAWREKTVYVATTIDLYTRKVVGISVALRKGAVLTAQALWSALLHYPHPEIFHSDNGTEYAAESFISLLNNCSIRISRSHPGCPWENGYQESFYDKFKVDLGDPNRFGSLGELVAEIYQTIWIYNNTRIHSALKMPPKIFAAKMQNNSLLTFLLSV